MKTVFDNAMCAHIWAQRSQPFGRSNSMSFDGCVIKSYQTPIAAFVPLARERVTKEPVYTSREAPRGVALVTCDSYSATTASKHLPAVCNAIRDNALCFSVPDIGYSGGRADTLRVGPASDPKSWKATHRANAAWMVKTYREEVARLLKSRSGGEWRVEQLEAKARAITQYAAVFGAKLPRDYEPSIRTDVAAIMARWDRLVNDPKAMEKARQRAARQELADADRLEKWRKFEGGPPSGEYAALRYNVTRQEFETSQGARVSLDDAAQFFALWDDAKAFGWLPSPAVGGQHMVSAFPLREIEKGGNVRIGCHRIRAEEIEAFRALLGRA